MILHRLLQGDGTELYLPFAQSRLRYLERIRGPKAFFDEKYIIDTFTVSIQQAPPFQYIRITGGASVSYEFFTSDHVNDNTLASPGHPGFVWGSATRAKFVGGKSRTTPCSSSTLTPGPADTWVFRDGNSLDDTTLGVYTRRSWQQQKFFEHAWHPNNDGKSLVTSCQAQAPGLAGQCNWMSPYNFARIASAGSKVSDFGLDVRPTLYTSGGLQTGAPILDQKWINYRHAAVQSAGGRRFFISTDNYGRFQIYPVKTYDTGLVPSTGYKQFTPPYPAWVSIPDPADYTRQVNDWLWRFNKDATKCVSIPYHSDFSSGFFKTLAGLQFFATILPDVAPNVAIQNALVSAHEDTPGLVELGIAITVTGPGDMDFNVTFTLLRESYFNVTNRFFFDAAYFMKDVEHLVTDAAYIAEDTLITAEVECKYPAGHYFADSGETPPHYLDLVQNLSMDIVLNANDAAMVRTEKFRATLRSLLGGKFPTVAGYPSGSDAVTLGGIGGEVLFNNGATVTVASAGPVAYIVETPARGGLVGNLYALELSTLSLLYEQDDFVAGTGFLRAMAYGAEFWRSDYIFTPVAGGPTSLPPPDTVATSARLCQWALDNVLNTEWGMGFSVHPAGHWAMSVNAELSKNTFIANGLDWISVKGKDAAGVPTRTRFRHKDLFDSAFKQTRDYPYYTETFPGKGYWDQGSFRTHGIWVTFK